MKRLLVILIIVSFFLILFGCVSLKVWPPKQISDCIAYEDLTDDFDHSKEDCYTYLATTNSDKSICNELDFISNNNCLKSYAIAKNDISICSEVSDTSFEIEFSGTYTSRDLCYFGLSSDNNNYCSLIADEKLRNSCVNKFDKSSCYAVQDLAERNKCFGINLISGVTIGLDSYYTLNNCDEKVDNLINNGIVYKRDFSNPNAYNELALDYCVIIKAINDKNTQFCSTLLPAGKGVVDHCYAMLSEYFQMDYCDSLQPSCTYTAEELRIDALYPNPNAFGKEYCKALSHEFEGNTQNIPSITDGSFCPNGVDLIYEPYYDSTNDDSTNDDSTIEYVWKKYTGPSTFPIDCTTFCNASEECLITSIIKGCFKSTTYDGKPMNNSGHSCVLNAPDEITEKDISNLYCCCPKS